MSSLVIFKENVLFFLYALWWVCTHCLMCAHTCTCGCACICTEAQGVMLEVFYFHLVHQSRVSLLTSELVDMTSLPAGPEAPISVFVEMELKRTAKLTWLLCGFWGSQLQSYACRASTLAIYPSPPPRRHSKEQ